MRPFLIGSTGSLGREPFPRSSSVARTPGHGRFLARALAFLGGLGATLDLRAQAAPASTEKSTESTAVDTTPLARRVPKENLVCYVAFAGLEANAEAWKKTAAYRMLNQTPLGVMLEEVAAQLLDKGMSSLPNRRLTGAEVVTLVKAAARQGWVLALNVNGKGPNPFVGTFVLRGAAAQELKSVTSRMVGMVMGPEAKPRIERQAGRVLVVVPRGAGPKGGWVWWAEKNDLVIGFMQPSNADAILAALDGKAPSAVEHPVLAELAKPEGSFRPLLSAFLDPSACPAEPKLAMTKFFQQLQSTAGLKRLDYRWGFDDDALMSVTRLIAPKPRKPLLALFDQPAFDNKSLIPLPQGVDSFVVMSVSPARVVEAIRRIGPAAEMKDKMDELFEQVRTQSRIDVEKDLLANLGPKMAFYLAPGRSAATTDETPEAVIGAGGCDLTAVLTALQARFPTPTLVAEVHEPTTFGRALDAVMSALNKELKSQAIERAAAEAATQDTANAPDQGRGQQLPAGRSSRRRGARETPAPEFRLMPGPVKTYVLVVPTESPLKIGPPGFRPTIRLEGKHVAFSSSTDSARLALDAIRRTGWKPSSGRSTLIPTGRSIVDPR